MAYSNKQPLKIIIPKKPLSKKEENKLAKIIETFEKETEAIESEASND